MLVEISRNNLLLVVLFLVVFLHCHGAANAFDSTAALVLSSSKLARWKNWLVIM